MKLTRKIYLSIFTTMFVIFTSVVTTFAWVGMFSSSSLGSFDLNLMVQDPKDVEYYLEISATGNEGTFDESIPLADVQSQIMTNMGIIYSSKNDTNGYSMFNTYEDYINYTFAKKSGLTLVTPGYDSSKDYKVDLSNFYEFENLKLNSRTLGITRKYFKFDLYLTVDTPSGIQSSTNINANVFFANITDALKANDCSGELITVNPFSTIPSTDANYGILSGVNGTVKINPVNATRLAFEVYDPINITDSYTGNEIPNSTIIYQGGTQLPNYNSITGVYNFGGILPERYNLAIKELNTLYNAHLDIDNKDSLNNYLYESANYRYINSVDKEMTVDNRVIWNSASTISGTNYLGVQGGVQTKMKITCYFWFEGWDADCMRYIDGKDVDIKIVFSTDRKE